MQLTDLTFLFDDNPSPMWIFELATLRILKVNKAAIARYGYPEQEFLTMNTRELLHASELKKFDVRFYQNGTGKPKRHGIIHSGLWKHQNKAHELIYADITSQDVKFEGRECRLVVAADGAEKVHYREAANWTKNNLEALINNTKDQIWSLDKETRYVYMNKAYRTQISQLTGVEPKKGSYSYLHPGYSEPIIEEWKQYYSRALAGERYSIIYESIEPLTQEILSFEISFNPIYKTKRDINGIGCFARNITEWLEKEKAIIDQNERLRHIASLTSHELRRPVASMLGLINIMDRENFFNPDNKEIIGHLLTVGKDIDEVIRLIMGKSFINDLLKNKYQSL